MSNYKDFWFASKDGLRLYARDYSIAASEGAQAEKPTIVCIPGLTRNSCDFAILCEYLSQRYRVIAVDLRGRGKSSYDPDPMNYHPGTYKDDMDALIKALNLESIILVGTSLGGLVSMFMSVQPATKIVGVVINDIGPVINPDGLARIRDYVSETAEVSSWAEAIDKVRSSQAREYPDFTDKDWVTFTENLYRENDSGIPVLNYDPNIAIPIKLAEELPQPADLWPLFGNLRDIPVLVLRGEMSDILTEECAQKMANDFELVTLATIDNRGHAPLLTEPQSVAAIDGFLASLPAPA